MTLDRIIGAMSAVRRSAIDGRETAEQQARHLIRELDCVEILTLEAELLAAGFSRERISQLFGGRHRGSLSATDAAPIVPPAGHPIEALQVENRSICADIRRLHADITALARDKVASESLFQTIQGLSSMDRHYRRIEDVLLPRLERLNLRGLSRILWAYHHGARNRLAALAKAASTWDRDAFIDDDCVTHFVHVAGALHKSVRLSMLKEEQIVIPLLWRVLDESDWDEVGKLCESISVPLTVQPGADGAQLPASDFGQPVFATPSGALTASQLAGILFVLPVDLTFVDAQDRVQFFTEGPDRVFPRGRGILGRKVQDCHPPKSVKAVDQILIDLRNQRRDIAEFWFSVRGRFTHVRYFAVRGPTKEYLGTLEVSQDVSRIRELHGEQRLLPAMMSPGCAVPE